MEHTTSDVDIFRKTTEVLDKLEQNQQLQQMAYENGIDTKNSCRLTAATKENIAVCVVSMLLAKQNNDPLCNDLVRFGMQHRNTKAQIVNKYKNEANALIKRYRNGEKPEEKIEVITIKSESSPNNSISESYQEFMCSSVGQYYLEGDGAYAVGTAIGGVVGLAIILVTLPFIIIINVLRAIVRFIKSIINAFRTFDVDKTLRMMERIPQDKRDLFMLELDGGATNLTLILSTAAIQELINEFDELSKNTSDVKSIDMKKWRELQDAVTIINQGQRVGKLGNRILGTLGAKNSGLRYDATKELLMSLKNIDVKAFASKVNDFNRLIEQKTREMKKAEAEARAAGGATNSNTDQMKSDADEIQRIGNNVLSTVQKWSSSTTTLLKSANAYVYQCNNGKWSRETMKLQ